MMGGFLAILVGLIALSFLPVIAAGWLFAGRRPYLVSALLLAAFIFLSSHVEFHPIASIIHYFVVVALYVVGGKIRTGKGTDELLSGGKKENG
ncbi:hypothetical protein QQS45_05285 [Alteriqipengyuania flavescens]|uniref:hypothetical protein n=1 Tax=Alteriqipengyuania flavescens TaxID=3053610 RepID=UPI0025B3577A|nr:hypothetical protein [Alteriqipengyuania flavescens]WJY19635.1 hypothetical protein QQW98_05280 [Alteriqipengyuania flavescens]WJY25575.1 hypothetical protein QQS45_05285 [Alteriqipengyuania flavescens]